MHASPKPYILIPTMDLGLARRTLKQIGAVAGMQYGSVISYNEKRIGFTSNFNSALAVIKGTSIFSHVCVINDDIRIDQEGWLKDMVEALDAHPSIGMGSAGGMCRTQPMCSARPDMPKGLERVRQLPFFCTLIKRRVIERLGYLDAGYTHYGSDSDYCCRALRAGFQLVHIQGVFVHNKLSPIIQPWKTQDVLRYKKRWGG